MSPGWHEETFYFFSHVGTIFQKKKKFFFFALGFFRSPVSMQRKHTDFVVCFLNMQGVYFREKHLLLWFPRLSMVFLYTGCNETYLIQNKSIFI